MYMSLIIIIIIIMAKILSVKHREHSSVGTIVAIYLHHVTDCVFHSLSKVQISAP